MKRSEINMILQAAGAFFRRHHVALPAFARQSPADLRASDWTEIKARGLGWDVTDYGMGNFAGLGLVLVTLRNGSGTRDDGMVSAEKLMMLRRGQICPMHCHQRKTEDIINRAGGTLVVELFASDTAGRRDAGAPVRVMCDGILRELPAGGRLKLKPGESVTLRPGDWHAFWAEGSDCLLGEVSSVNDDVSDNRFDPDLPRFATVEEDAPPWRLLVSDYDRALP